MLVYARTILGGLMKNEKGVILGLVIAFLGALSLVVGIGAVEHDTSNTQYEIFRPIENAYSVQGGGTMTWTDPDGTDHSAYVQEGWTGSLRIVFYMVKQN